jgi:hypothetical protein
MSSRIVPSPARFTEALRAVSRPSARELRFLRAHYAAPGRALTATRLAEAAGYVNYGGVNLRYGLLAARIGEEMGNRGARLSFLVDFVRPKEVTNREWVLVMQPHFATALKRAGWV